MTDANRPNAPQPESQPSDPMTPPERAPMTPEQARLHEALQRSRAIPLDGPMETDVPSGTGGSAETGGPTASQDRTPAPQAHGATSVDGAAAADRGHDEAHPTPAASGQRPVPSGQRPGHGGATRAGAHDATAAESAGDPARLDDGSPDVQPRPAPAPSGAGASRADTDELRSEADYERALAADAEADTDAEARRPAPAVRAADEDAVRKDADAFAPLGISDRDGAVVRPERRSNRGFALLIAVIATLVFAILYAGLFSLARVIYAPGSVLLPTAVAFIGTAPFYVAVVIFFVGMLLWSVLTNRGGWASFVVAGLVLGGVTFLAYHLGVAVQQLVNSGSWDIAPMLASLRAPEHLPGALIAFFTAREVITWLGGIIALRGRKLTRENTAELEEYERRRVVDAA